MYIDMYFFLQLCKEIKQITVVYYVSSATKKYVSVMEVFSKFFLAKPLAFSNKVYWNKRPTDLDNHLITIALDWPVKWSYFCILSFIFSLNLQSPKLLWLLLSRLFKKHFCTKKRGGDIWRNLGLSIPQIHWSKIVSFW